MKQLKEMSKDKLMKLIMKYYKSINSKKDLVNELLENFEVDLNTFSKTRIHKLIHNYYNGLTEAQLRKEVMDNFELELPKKKEEPKKKKIYSIEEKYKINFASEDANKWKKLSEEDKQFWANEISNMLSKNEVMSKEYMKHQFIKLPKIVQDYFNKHGKANQTKT